MGEQALRGAGDVAVGLEEGLDGLHEPRLVLLVVGDERLHRLGVEALQLGRVLAHGAQQQAVGARLLEGEHGPVGVALGHVGRQQRLGAGAVQVDRVRRGPAAPERERVAGERALQLAQDGLGGARGGRVVGAGQEDHDLGAHGLGARRQHGGGAGQTARAPRSATPRTRWRQPSSVGTCECARATTMLAPSTRSRPSSPARPRMSSRPEMSRSSSACRKPASACSDARSGARRRSTSEAIRVVTSLTSAGPGLAATAHAQRAHRGVGHAQLDRVDPGRVVEQRALVGRRARGDGQHCPGAVGQHEAGIQRPRRRADDLGQAGARLDGVGDRVQRSEVEPGRRSVGRGGHAPILRRSPC